MLYFSRWKALAIILTALVVCLFAVPNFFPEATVKTWPKWAQRHLVLGPRFAGRFAYPARGRCQLRQEGKARPDPRRRAPHAARRQDPLYRAQRPRRRCRSAHHQGHRLCNRADASCASCRSRSAGCSAPAASAALKSPMPAAGLIRLTVPQAAITERIRQIGRAIDPDRRASRQRTRHGRAADPAPGAGPHSGAGAGPAGSDRG